MSAPSVLSVPAKAWVSWARPDEGHGVSLSYVGAWFVSDALGALYRRQFRSRWRQCDRQRR
eukprot:12346781-Alexandrium_andersonii.AAC.1